MVGCGRSFTAAPPGKTYEVLVSWTANHEKAVNQTGGGYTVSYGRTWDFVFDSGTKIDVPYVSGNSAPTSTTLGLTAGTYYIRIKAYSSLNGPGVTTGSVSAASSVVAITVP